MSDINTIINEIESLLDLFKEYQNKGEMTIPIKCFEKVVKKKTINLGKMIREHPYG